MTTQEYINGPAGVETLKKYWGISEDRTKPDLEIGAVTSDIYGTKSGNSNIPKRRNGKKV